MTTSAYVLEHNKRRLLILLGVLSIILFFYGIRSVFEGIVGFIGQAPFLVIQLLFLLIAGIAQFAGLMWFLSRPRTYTVVPDSPQIGLSFENYRGQPDLLEHAKSTVRILRGVQRFTELGGEVPRGMLLSGAPGTGKTFLAGVIAAEANLPFIYVDASSLSSMWFGVDALIVMSLFRRARGLARKYKLPGTPGATILFIDELDSIGMARSGVMGAGQQQAGMMGGMMGMGRFGLNALLNQMDSLGQHIEDRMSRKIARWLGFIRGPVPPKPVVFVIGATNRPDVLDPALVRPGRLDRRLNVYEPDGPGRKDIIEHYLKQKAHDPSIDVKMMVADSIGWTPIEIKTIINEALIIAHDLGREAITYRDWLQARDTRQLGLKQPIASMSDKDKRTIAYHEAGHAVAARYLNLEDRIQKASIIRMGDALGVVQWSPKEERYQLHQQEMETRIMVSLGSRAVEELYLGTKTANASHDLQSATGAAMAYVGNFGMGPTLLAIPANPMGGASPQVLRLADKLLETLYEDTKRLMREKEYAVHAVAQALLQKGELIGPELEEIFVFADEANPDKAAPFQRKPVELPKLFDEVPHQNGALTASAAAAITAGEANKTSTF